MSRIVDINGDKYVRRKNICYYQNGMFDFNDFYLHISGFEIPQQKVRQRKRY